LDAQAAGPDGDGRRRWVMGHVGVAWKAEWPRQLPLAHSTTPGEDGDAVATHGDVGEDGDDVAEDGDA
jgi:hypothetical protein